MDKPLLCYVQHAWRDVTRVTIDKYPDQNLRQDVTQRCRRCPAERTFTESVFWLPKSKASL